MPRRRTASRLVAIVAYLYALLVAPWLHAAHHARHGDDHVHDASGTHAITLAHEALHEDLAALGLEDVATAGTLAVDCALADYTLAECDAAVSHAPRFGDALVAHRRAAPDPTHGRGAIEHGAITLVPASPLVLPPPSRPLLAELSALPDAQRPSSRPRTPVARGPPA